MSANFQMMEGFDNLYINNSHGTFKEDYTKVRQTAFDLCSDSEYYFDVDGGFLRGNCLKNSHTLYLTKFVEDKDQLVLGFSWKYYSTSSDAIFGFYGDSHSVEIRTGITDHAQLYVDGSEVAEGSIVINTGNPWVYFQLYVNKTTGKVQVIVNDVVDIQSNLPSSFVVKRAEMHFPAYIDDVVIYDSSAPLGTLKVDGYYAGGATQSGFNDGTDGGATDPAETENGDLFTYRASATQGQQDMYTFSNALPSTVEIDSILAVEHVLHVSSGSFKGASLNKHFKVGTTDDVIDVSDNAEPFTPMRVSKIYTQNPDTSSDWTRSDVQGISAGYSVK